MIPVLGFIRKEYCNFILCSLLDGVRQGPPWAPLLASGSIGQISPGQLLLSFMVIFSQGGRTVAKAIAMPGFRPSSASMATGQWLQWACRYLQRDRVFR